MSTISIYLFIYLTYIYMFLAVDGTAISLLVILYTFYVT